MLLELDTFVAALPGQLKEVVEQIPVASVMSNQTAVVVFHGVEEFVTELC